MKRFTWVLAVGFLSIFAIGVQTSHTQAPAASAAPAGPPAGAPGWAFPMPDPVQPPTDANAQVRIPDSTKTMTATQVDDLFTAADWFPDQNPPRPDIITKGRQPNAMACGVCHLMSGMGHPESADLAGLPVNYIVNQMNDFKSGVRKDYARMNGIAAATTPEEWQQAAQWFSSLKPLPWYKVVETETVPKTYLTGGRMRVPSPDGGTEPIGNRIIVVPQDPARVLARDPRIGFIANVPPGSVAKGEALVSTGGNGKTIACSICHGQGLKGLGDVPRLAGVHPTYLVRQLFNFKTGNSNGMAAVLMKPVAANLTDEDMTDIAAYIAGLPEN
jgi:cytochrome c553